MNQPIPFNSTTARFALPLLFQGQAQKEFYVNEAHTLLDALMHPVIEGADAAPPASPQEGQCWLVSGAASGAWIGREGMLAVYAESSWLFVAPVQGMRVFDKSAGQSKTFDGDWNAAAAPATPQGGTSIDAEARMAIGEIIAALRLAGILPK